MNKLPDINYALMAQLSYLHWNNLKDIEEDTTQIKKLLFIPEYISQIKTDFYDEPTHYPSNETIAGKPGKLKEYTYHEEDKRLFLVYSTEKSDDKTKTKFGKILEGWEYLDCATGEIIEKKFFGEKILDKAKYEESGFFGVAFQRGNDIMIAYRGTEFELAFARDMKTDFNIYFKETDIQQFEAVLFYEYIKTKYGEGKNIHITGHSLAGAIAQYVYFYASFYGNYHHTITWNGLGAEGSSITSQNFLVFDDETEKVYGENRDSIVKDKVKFSYKIKNMNLKESDLSVEKKDELVEVEERLKGYYSSKTSEGKLKVEKLKEHREHLKEIHTKKAEEKGKIMNYFMHEDFVGGYLNGDWIGEKEVVDVPKKDLKKSLVEVTPKLLLVASLFKNGKYSLKNRDILTKVGYIYLVSSIGGTVDTLKDKYDEIRKILEKQSKTEDLLEFLEVFETIDMSEFTDLGQDMVYPLLNLFDEEGLKENLKENLQELRRFSEKSVLGVTVVTETMTALKFHNINNFLVFMKDDGDVNLKEMRREFRRNALKTIVKLKEEKNYRFLKGKNRNNPSEDILEIKNQDIAKRIYSPANRLVVGNIFTPCPITQTDILFRENFVRKKFNGSDMEVIKNKLDGAYNGELILGEYNNLNELGGIIGQSPIVIKIYPISLGEEEEQIENRNKVITFGIIKNIYSLKN